MVKEQVFKLNPRAERPMLHIETEIGKMVWALYDTGAYIPVWTAKEEIFLQHYKNATFAAKTNVGWFGGNTPGRVYRVDFTLGEITYPQMPIFIPDEEQVAPYSIILSATMLRGLDYNIDTRHNYMIIHFESVSEMVRNLTFTNKNGKLIVLANN